LIEAGAFGAAAARTGWAASDITPLERGLGRGAGRARPPTRRLDAGTSVVNSAPRNGRAARPVL
jgi:hypothetical protein